MVDHQTPRSSLMVYIYRVI